MTFTTKRVDVSLITYLSMAEMEAILNAPDLRTRMGIRDRAMLGSVAQVMLGAQQSLGTGE